MTNSSKSRPDPERPEEDADVGTEDAVAGTETAADEEHATSPTEEGPTEPGPELALGTEAVQIALTHVPYVGRAAWRGEAFGEARSALESVPVPPAQGHFPVLSPTVDRAEFVEPRFFDTPVVDADGSVLIYLRRPYLWPSGALPGDPARQQYPTTRADLGHIAYPQRPWRTNGRGRRR